MFHFILHWTGVQNSTGRPYAFWSGIAGDFGEIVLLGYILNWYKNHKCTNCWRLSKHDVKGTHYATCHKHTTTANHIKLWHTHKCKYPEQHDFLNPTTVAPDQSPFQ